MFAGGTNRNINLKAMTSYLDKQEHKPEDGDKLYGGNH